MPINVFGNSSGNSNGDKIDTSLFVQKPYLRSNYIEANIEEHIDLKNQYRIKNVPDPISIREVCSKNYADNLFNDPSIVKNNAHIDLNDRNITNARFIQVNQLPQIDSHLTTKLYVDTEIDQPSLVRNNQDNDFSNYNLTNINSITLNKQAESDNEVITKAYVDQFHQENERSRRNVGLSFYNEEVDLVKNNQDNDFNDNKLTNLDSVKINRNPTLDNEVANKKYVDDSIGGGNNNVLKFDQSEDNYLKVSVGNNTYNLTKYDKIQLTDITVIRVGNSGALVLPLWKITCNNKHNNGNIASFIRSTKPNSPTSDSGATSLPPIGNAFMYIETSANNSGSDNIFVSWERTDIIKITNVTFYYNRFSISSASHRSMGRFRIQLLLDDDNWSTRYNIPKNDRYSDNSTDWTLVSLNFTVENYGIKMIYDQIDTAHADMCFSNITITHSVY